MTFTVEDIKRFPAVTQIHFIECSGNGRAAYRTPRPDMTPQQVDGMTSQSEWTGVPLSLLLRETGVQHDAKWFLAEGGDSCLLARSIPVAKAFDDALIAWAQNGEPLRPEQGFPIRLLLPGFEGNTNVKWLRRLKFGTEPFMTRWETSKYTDPLPGGKARLFSLEMDAKSIITSPAYPERLASPGWWPIRGLAWSGRGRITRVDVSTDGGATWQRGVAPHAVARESARAVRAAVALDRRSEFSHEPRRRRHGLRAADVRRASIGARSGDRVPLQLHSRLARRARRLGDVRGQHVNRGLICAADCDGRRRVRATVAPIARPIHRRRFARQPRARTHGDPRRDRRA